MEDKTYTYIFYDILDKVLQLSMNPSQFAEYLSQQIRELIGARTVVIATKNAEGNPEIYSVFPLRKKGWGRKPEIVQLAGLSFDYDKIKYLEIENADERIKAYLGILEIKKIIVIPLIAADQNVGSILLLDIMDDFGMEAVMDLLSRLSGVFALIIRNSRLYYNLESLVTARTRELQERNQDLQVREQQLKSANEEYEALNEELSENIEKVRSINSLLELAKENAEISEAHMRNILQTAMDGFWAIDYEAKFIGVNDIACKMLGYSKEELIGMSVSDIEFVENAEDTKNHIRKVFQHGEDRFESRHRCKNGQIIDVEISVTRQPEQNIMVAFVRDITNRKLAEQELMKAKEKAEESDRLKTSFLQNMSHEIRTPMNAICGFSGMLGKPELSEEKKKSFISIIQNSSTQLLSIVTDILTISSIETRQEKVNIQKVNINHIILELLSIFKSQAKAQNIALYAKKEMPDKQAEIYTDQTKLTQILTNLLTNALKFTHQGSIEFGYMYSRDALNGVSLKQDMLTFYVKDTGIGIRPEFQQKIFERFHQADASINKKYGGTGLGLSISKGFAELLGGTIRVESVPGEGSTFFFTIPYKPVNETTIPVISEKHNDSVKTILVAEDEEYNDLLIEELLIDMGVQLLHAKNGHEVIAICKESKSLDLILMDIKMPLLDGYTAALQIKAFRPDLPIIAQSAYALAHEREKYSGNAFDDYITKPIDQDELILKVKRFILSS